MAKKARSVREDSQERQQTSYELRVRIQKALNLPDVPTERMVKTLLDKREQLKDTGYVK